MELRSNDRGREAPIRNGSKVERRLQTAQAGKEHRQPRALTVNGRRQPRALTVGGAVGGQALAGGRT